MEIVNNLRILRRRWRLVAVLVVVGVALGAASAFIGGDTQTDTSLYKATISLTSNGNKSVNLSQLAALTTESEVSKRAAAKLGGSPAALSSQITAKAQPELDLLKITAIGADPTRAVQIANTFGEEVSAYQVDLQARTRDAQIADLQRQKEALRPLYDAALRGPQEDPANKDRYNAQYQDVLNQSKQLDSQIARIQGQAGPAAVLTVISTAEAVPVSGKAVAQLFADSAPKAGSGSNSSTNTTVDPQAALETTFGTPAEKKIGPLLRAGIGGAAGLLLGAAIALLIERIDPRIRTKQEAEDAFGWPVITETPPISRKQRKQLNVLSFDAPRSRFAESYRSLRSAVLFACAVSDGTAPLDSRELPSGGRARRGSASLAAEYHASGSHPARVIMVTSPSPSEGKTTTTSNLAAVLAEAGFKVLVVNCDFRRPRVHSYLGAAGDTPGTIETGVPGVSLISRVLDNPELANPAEVVAAQRDAIDRNRNAFDFILLDTAPLLSTNDAAEVLDESDFVVVVGRTGQTTKESADRAAELMERRNAPVVGVVLVGATDRPSSRYYYYGDAGRYYEDDEPVGPAVSDDGNRNPLEQLSGKSDPGSTRDRPPAEREPVGASERPDGTGTDEGPG